MSQSKHSFSFQHIQNSQNSFCLFQMRMVRMGKMTKITEINRPFNLYYILFRMKLFIMIEFWDGEIKIPIVEKRN